MKIFELTLTKLRYREFIEEIKGYISHESDLSHSHTTPLPNPLLPGEGTRLIFTPNPEICLRTLEDTEFLKVLRQADYLTSDGIGLYLAYQINNSKYHRFFLFLLLPYYIFNILFRKKYLYQKYGERICGSDLTSELVTFAEKNALKIAIIDPYFPEDEAKCEAQKHFGENLSQVFPKLDFEYYIIGDDNKGEILETLKNSDAKICFATLGMKRQEMFCLEVRNHCLNIKLALGVGSAFDYYTGFQKRAPRLWRDLGFEWLYRIFTSPNKLKRLGRIYQALIVFPLKIITYKKM